MRTRRTSIVLTGAVGLAALTGGAVVAPALATAATSEVSAVTAVADRVDRIKDALQGLVDDGTLTEAQRDKVAEALDEGMPGRGRGLGPGNGQGHGPGHGLGHGRGIGPGGRVALDVAADRLGMTESELVDALREGKSLAGVAAEKGVSLDDLTAALVKAAEEHLARAVADGRLTQAEADEKKADIAERIAAGVQREGLPGRGMGMGQGRGMGQGLGQGKGSSPSS
jgi:hypothetical protein